ncbi:MAG: hypothetical protein ACYDCC_06095 [Actinomycetota bacterium]
MSRIGATLAAAIIVVGIGSSAWAATGTCVSRGGGPAPGHPGVVLGPATKCVRSSSSDQMVNYSPAASAHSTHKVVFPWGAAAVVILVLGGSSLARKISWNSGARSVRRAA